MNRYLPAYIHDLLQKLITQALCQSPAVPIALILLALPGLLLAVLS